MQRQKGRAAPPRPHDDLLRYLRQEKGLNLQCNGDGWGWSWPNETGLPHGEGFPSEGMASVAALSSFLEEGIDLKMHLAVVTPLINTLIGAHIPVPIECADYFEEFGLDERGLPLAQE